MYTFHLSHQVSTRISDRLRKNGQILNCYLPVRPIVAAMMCDMSPLQCCSNTSGRMMRFENRVKDLLSALALLKRPTEPGLPVASSQCHSEACH